MPKRGSRARLGRYLLLKSYRPNARRVASRRQYRWSQALRQRIMLLPDWGQMTFETQSGTDDLRAVKRHDHERRRQTPNSETKAARSLPREASVKALVPGCLTCSALGRVADGGRHNQSGSGFHAPPHQASSRRTADDQPASFRSRVAVSICGVKRRSRRQRSTKRSGSGKKPACKPAR
jgi:hypothetical protein